MLESGEFRPSANEIDRLMLVRHLPPGGCYTADLQFLALRSGVLNVDALRIVDLATQEVADIRELPTIVAAD